MEFIRLADPTRATCETAQRGTRTIIRADMITSAVSIRTSYPPYSLCTPLVAAEELTRPSSSGVAELMCAYVCDHDDRTRAHRKWRERRDDWETYN